MLTFAESLSQRGWTHDGYGWTSPCGAHWFEFENEAAAFAERGNAMAYDSNYADEWE